MPSFFQSIFDYVINKEHWPLIISLFSLIISIIGWSVTYKNQQKITTQQNLDANEREKRKLISQRKLSQLEDLKKWFDECLIFYRTRENLFERDPAKEGHRENIPEDYEDADYYYEYEEIKEKVDAIDAQIKEFLIRTQKVSYTASLLDPCETVTQNHGSLRIIFRAENQHADYLEVLVDKMKDLLGPDQSKDEGEFFLLENWYERAVNRIEQISIFYSDLSNQNFNTKYEIIRNDS